MGPDLLHRVRWRNLARAVAAVSVVAAVVAWPRVGPPEPRLPGAGAVPLVKPAATVGVATPVEPAATPSEAQAVPPVARKRVRPRRGREPRRPRRAAVRGGAGSEQRGAEAIAGGGGGEPVRPPLARAPAGPVPVPPSGDPVQDEFGIEGG